MHRLYIILLGAVGSMSLVAAAFNMSAKNAEPEAAAGLAQGEAATADWEEAQSLLLKRDSTGQFHVNAAINGESVRFLVDTGADMVALTPEEAEALGLVYGEMQPIMQTAAGTGWAAPVMLDEVEVAGVVVRDVAAVVAQDLPVNLLGQSVLRKLGSVELKGDSMVIRAR